MAKTTLAQKEAIRELLASEEAYKEIATQLCLTLRTARKWGQAIKKGGLYRPRWDGRDAA